MQISTKDWINYISKLTELSETAGNLMKEYVGRNGFGDTDAIIDYAYALVTKYGNGTATLAAAMYDAIAEMQRKIVPPAEPAPTSEYGNVAKAVNGTIKKSKNLNTIGGTINRLVKKASTDTMLINAARDGAEYAWVPMGDTCAFCITLASRGWLSISRDKLKNHRDHLHSNCDCTYAVRFDGKSGVAGYDPDKYLEIYQNAEGTSSEDKINAIRRMYYAEHKDMINAQKRAAYAERKMRDTISNMIDVTEEYKKNATPHVGEKIKEDGFEDKNGEEQTADWLYETFGGNIILLAETNPDGVSNPDYLWNNKLWDLKAPQTLNGVDKRVRHGLHQIADNSGGLIVDITNLDQDIDKIYNKIENRVKSSAQDDLDIIICRSQKIIKIVRYKK